MANWRDLFRPWILERGQEYFECGQVTELEDDGGLVRAEVSGRQDYHVEIRRSGKRLDWMSCDCPYADKDENCKHMAAVLFELEHRSAQQRLNCRLEWQVALEKLSEEQMRVLLRSMAEGDGSLQDRIVRLVAGPGTEPSQWQDELEQIIGSVKCELLCLLTVEIIKLHLVSPLWGRRGHSREAFPGGCFPFADRDSVHRSSFGISRWGDRTHTPCSSVEPAAWRSGSRGLSHGSIIGLKIVIPAHVTGCQALA